MDPRGGALLVAVLLVVSAYTTQGRVIKQTGWDPSTVPVAPEEDNSNFNIEENTFYAGVRRLGTAQAASAQACAELCHGDLNCEFWSWCPLETAGGCQLASSLGVRPQTVPAGQCLLSADNTSGRTSVTEMKGPEVAFVAGMWGPSVRTPAGQAGGAAAAAAAPPALCSDNGATVWQHFTCREHEFYRGVDMLGSDTAASTEECATICHLHEPCQFWSWCPLSRGEAGCEAWSVDGKKEVVPAGTCMLSQDTMPDRNARLRVFGPSVSFIGGMSAVAGGPAPGEVSDPVVIVTEWEFPKGGKSTVRCPIFRPGPIFLHDVHEWGATASGSTELPDITEYGAELCEMKEAAGAALAAAVLAGGDRARAAVAAMMHTQCPNGVSLLSEFETHVNPSGNQHGERLLTYLDAFIHTADAMGVPACVGFAVLDKATKNIIYSTAVHTGDSAAFS